MAFINFGNHHDLFGMLALVVFILTRLYYLGLAYIALKSLHKLARRQDLLAFFLGYLPAATVAAVVQCGMFSLLALLANGDFD